MFGIGLFASAKIGVGIGSEVARQHRNSFENSAVTQQSLDSHASKEDGNRQHHILHGSRRSREQHAPIWRKFNIDPDGGNGWEKLLPLLNEVKEFGEKRSEVEQNGGKVVTYAREYVEKGVEIIVETFVNTDGKATISDAWGEYLYWERKV